MHILLSVIAELAFKYNMYAEYCASVVIEITVGGLCACHNTAQLIKILSNTIQLNVL